MNRQIHGERSLMIGSSSFQMLRLSSGIRYLIIHSMDWAIA